MRDDVKLYLASSLFLLISLIILLWFTVEYEFPLLAYALEDLPRLLIPLKAFREVSSAVGRFLWGWRMLDLLSQAFVILAAIICCIALLKPGGEER